MLTAKSEEENGVGEKNVNGHTPAILMVDHGGLTILLSMMAILT
jgi:hypothetical protein